MKLVGKAWNLPMMADAIAQTLGNALKAWSAASASAAASPGDTEQTFWQYQAPPHRCGPGCGGYREWAGPWDRPQVEETIPNTQEGAPTGPGFVEEVD